MEEGLLIIRLVFGLALAAHGAQKLFGLFGGHGIAGTGAFFDTMGFRPGRTMATAAGLAETVGGVAFAVGALTPFTAAVMVATMLVAIWGVHRPNGFFAQNGGYELPLLIAAVAIGVAVTGPGALSLDAALGLDMAGVRWGAISLVLGICGALPPLVTRGAVQSNAA